MLFVTAWIICTNLVFCEFMRGFTRFILSSDIFFFSGKTCQGYTWLCHLGGGYSTYDCRPSAKWCKLYDFHFGLMKFFMLRIKKIKLNTLPKLLNLFNGPHGMGSYLGRHSNVGIWKWALWVINLFQKQFAKVYFRGIATGDNFVRDLKTIPWMAFHSHSKVS